MDQYLERHNLPKNTQELTGNLNRFMSIKEIESIINNLPKQKAPGPDGFTGEFFQTLKEEIIPILHNLSHKIEAKGILRNLFYQAIITLLPFKIKDITRKENYRPTSLIHIDAKILNKI